MPQDEKNARTRLEPRRILAAMGPGMVAALAGADAGGVATYSNAGALFGFMQLWTVPVMCFLLIVAQETAARMGCVTGKGLASLIREQFGVRLSALAMAALLVSNTTVTLSEFAGIASALALFDVPVYVSVPVAALAIWLLTMSGSYRRIEKVLLAVACVFVTYIVAGVMVGPDWGDALLHTVVPHVEATPRYLSLLVASVGTAIAPWMLFLAQSNVVEKNAHAEDLPYQRVDTVTGAVAASVISWFIILTTGAVLHPAGVVVNGAEEAATALAPLVGDYAELLFGAGLTGASFLAACVLPGITSSAICEAFGWERGADRSWAEAPVYRGIITAVIAVSALVVMLPDVNLFGIMMVAQVINGVLLPVILVFMVLIASDKHVMGRFANGRGWNALTWFTIAAVTILTVIMFVMQAMGV
ncbi:Nramp family divalent metal transporter [Olsenella sp. DSM 107455]|uniref:Nramp family divalent metal transporter n=1 Tax=Thermophilibacter gallinarum TaxID=2779357 RepID=A0ABR9QQL8_9ACTN|nr:Nramp family divalent metal transporter [Thermophilibacter gallinarum]MBE5023371.1 Nramp family divalent metal transporter [Thermophilibacter gallinarum]